MNHPVDEVTERLLPHARAYYDRIAKHRIRFDVRLYTRRKVRYDLTRIVASLAWLGHVTGQTPESLRDTACPKLP